MSDWEPFADDDDQAPDPAALVEEDEPCCICGAVPGTIEYGTIGDGFDGMCPSCADKAEERDSEL